MKLHLLLSAALMLLSAASAKSFEPKLRGVSADFENESDPSEDAPAVIFEGSDPFDDGVKDGRKTANRLWRDMGSDCANAWDFESSSKKKAKKKGWNSNGRNWKERAYNKGARTGMDEVVKEKEKKCLNDKPDECIGLGETAASMISHEYCGMGSAYRHQNYKRECRSVAISQCKGSVFGKVRSACGSPDTRTLNQLQGKCRRQVDSLIGNNDFIIEE